jgi:2-oxoglutarate dehydrogenase E2 component (dihydrolipoamide succinyltransferase)
MAKYKLLLPKMGESVAEATVIKWTKNPGDYVEADETVMEIATDKVDSEVPSPVSGKLIEQLYKENDVVQVGDVIAVIETGEPSAVAEPETIAPVNAVVEEEQEPVETTATEVNETPESVIESGKAETAIPAEIEQPVFNEQRADIAQAVPYVDQLEKRSVTAEDNSRHSLRFYSPLVKSIATQEGIGNEELERIAGTGADGRLTKDDLLAYIQNRHKSAFSASNGVQQNGAIGVDHTAPAQGAPAAEKKPNVETQVSEPVKPAAKEPLAEPVKQEAVTNGTSVSAGDEIIEMDRMRRLIADHMVMSKQTSPHVTSFVEADVTNLVSWRDRIKNSFEKREGEKITFTPIFIEAVVKAIKDLPMINIQVDGSQIIKKKDINISMATALPSGNLIVPVIKKADDLNLQGLTKAVNDLANRARNNKLKPDDIKGGTFTITNVGSFGNVMGTPIINQPQVAILAVGAIKKKPAVIETPQGDMIAIRHMMFLSLSYDHRVVDGALGGTFVRRVADYLEKWDVNREI